MLLLAFRLVAHGIGGRTVRELERTMEEEEFLMWAAYMQLEPFGETRADWRTAMMMAQVANMNRGRGKAAIPVSRFLLRFEDGPRREKTMEELEQALYQQYIAWGGKPKK